jgi:exo-beta-1,3-glucanase (GH17 family)
MNEMTLRDIKRSITHEIQAAAERLRKDITENDLGDEALLNRAVRASQLRNRIRDYEAIVGEVLDVCHQHLDTAVQAFSVASAVQEDDEVYDGVFS